MTMLGAAHIHRPRQQTRADKHVMNTATKRANALELQLHSPLVNKITRSRGTLKQSLREAKHSQTAVYITAKSRNASHHDTAGKWQCSSTYLLKWPDRYVSEHIWKYSSYFDRTSQVFPCILYYY